VLAEQSHFGVWIDGDGEACTFLDERGRPIGREKVFLALCRYVCEKQPGAGVVLEPAASGRLQNAIEQLGARAIRAGASREEMAAAMETAGAVIGLGAGDRFWYSGPPAVSDALLCLSLMLALLSQTDRPLSEVLDAGGAAG
jgi:phosphomannomutase